MGSAASSLRERSKARRRDAIQRAAMRLFAERGYEGATIADIAQAAEVAPRTVSVYFPNKINIAMSVSNDMAERLTATFSANPGLSFTDVVDRWVAGEAESLDLDLARTTVAMFASNPALRSVSTSHIVEAASVSRPALVAQLGRAAGDPLVAVVHASVSAAISEYLVSVLAAGAAGETHDEFVRYLRAIIGAAGPGRRSAGA